MAVHWLSIDDVGSVDSKLSISLEWTWPPRKEAYPASGPRQLVYPGTLNVRPVCAKNILFELCHIGFSPAQDAPSSKRP